MLWRTDFSLFSFSLLKDITWQNTAEESEKSELEKVIQFYFFLIKMHKNRGLKVQCVMSVVVCFHPIAVEFTFYYCLW